MSLQTFSASTMAEALLQVKRTFGHDAVILHTRTVQRRYMMGLRKRELIEVTAGPANSYGATADRRRPIRDSRDIGREQSARPNSSGQDASRQNVASSASSSRTPANRSIPSDTPARTLSPAAAAYARNSGSPARPTEIAASRDRASSAAPARLPNGLGAGGRSFFDSPEMTQAMVRLVTEEVTGLRSELKELVTHVRRGGTQGQTGSTKSPTLPAELFEHYQRLIESQVADELAEDILKAVRLQVPAGYLSNEAFVREKVAEQLEKLLPVSGPIKRTKPTGPHVVALIGPTGVGKTTTIAKLAANLQLREGKRVGLITIDTYRIAAVDQLRRYADIIGSSLKVVGTPEEMPVAIAAMSDMDYILIDTAGRSPTDSLKLSELRGFLEAAKPDEVHLVLSTTSSPQCVELAVTSFSRVRVDKLLFTKIDEAASVGIVLNVARKVGKSLSYMTTGQDVPDDIEVVRGRKLAHLILGGDRPDTAAPASSYTTHANNLSTSSRAAGVAVAGGVQ